MSALFVILGVPVLRGPTVSATDGLERVYMTAIGDGVSNPATAYMQVYAGDTPGSLLPDGDEFSDNFSTLPYDLTGPSPSSAYPNKYFAVQLRDASGSYGPLSNIIFIPSV